MQLHSHMCCHESCSARRTGLPGLLWKEGKASTLHIAKVPEGRRASSYGTCQAIFQVPMVKGCLLYTTRAICPFPLAAGKNASWGISHSVRAGGSPSRPVHSSLSQAFETQRQEGTRAGPNVLDTRWEERGPPIPPPSLSPVERQYCER